MARFPRASGILLHVTSLPGPHGVGDLGPSAFEFLEFLRDAGQTWWQVLPLSPTGFADSPYQTFSSFAGNPLLISLDRLADQGLLNARELKQLPGGPVEYEIANAYKRPLLQRAFQAFRGSEPAEFRRFCSAHHEWLDDFALFLALKDAHGGIAWPGWEPGARSRDAASLGSWRERLGEAIAARKFEQWIFFEQWNAIRARAAELGIRIMGDTPIYAAHDSADVWRNPELFHLDARGEVALMAGVPPDYFSATGQLWGNPIYRWEIHEQTGYQWWVQRLLATFELFDAVRIDHFRGFHAYWAVPQGQITAIQGEWLPGPGAKFFETVMSKIGDRLIVAENLGVITPEVEAIRHRFGFPGMAILQFAFGKDPQAPDFRPHNYPRDVVVYTGTHDNDTTMGWWTSTGEGDSTRTVRDIAEEREFALRYLNTSGTEIHWSLIRAALASVANTALIPAQDLLGLGSEARMNLPATTGNNWRWRLQPGQLTPAIAARLRDLTSWFDRN